jgi:hypothetical protein
MVIFLRNLAFSKKGFAVTLATNMTNSPVMINMMILSNKDGLSLWKTCYYPFFQGGKTL